MSPLLATHGGANPEEVFVPYLEFDGAPPHVDPPDIAVQASVMAETPRQGLVLALRNRNPVVLTDLTLDADLFEAPLSLSSLARGAEVIVHPELIGGPYPPGRLAVSLTIRYAAPGMDPTAKEMTLQLAIESALQPKTDAERAFEEMFDD